MPSNLDLENYKRKTGGSGFLPTREMPRLQDHVPGGKPPTVDQVKAFDRAQDEWRKTLDFSGPVPTASQSAQAAGATATTTTTVTPVPTTVTIASGARVDYLLVRNETTQLYHELRLRNNQSGVPELYLSNGGIP